MRRKKHTKQTFFIKKLKAEKLNLEERIYQSVNLLSETYSMLHHENQYRVFENISKAESILRGLE